MNTDLVITHLDRPLLTLPTPARPFNALDSLAGRSLGTSRQFEAGFGDPALLTALAARFDRMSTPAPIQVRWITLPYTEHGITRMRGFFESPASLELPLPPASRAAYFELLLPQGSSPAVRPPVCIYPASGGDQGLNRRRRFVAPLVRQGVGALLLENPFYGLRRPQQQRGFALKTVADHLLMVVIAMEEVLALLAWLEDSGFKQLGAAGYSMGGYIAGGAAARWRKPLATIVAATSQSPGAVFTQSPLRHSVDWAKLRGDKTTLHQLFERFSLARLPAPQDHDLSVVLGGKKDAVCSPAEVSALAAHWGVKPAWFSGGHVSALWLSKQGIQETILDTFGLLMAKHQR